LHFIFDRQDQFAPYATRYFQKALRHGLPPIRRQLGDLAFKSKVGVGGLQAADLLAHACYRRTETEGRDALLDYVTGRLEPIARERIVLFDETTMRVRIKTAPEELRRRWR
jgi:hypothetical protein